MGYIPIFLAIGGFFFLWGGLIWQTLYRLRSQLHEAFAARANWLQTYPAIAGLSLPELEQARQANAYPVDALAAEAAYKRLTYRYKTLVRQPPYSVFAKAFGHVPSV